MQLDGQAQYRNGEFTGQGHTHARQVTFASLRRIAAHLDATADYALENRQLSLTNLAVTTWGGKATGALRANFDDLPPRFQLSAQLHQLRLEDALQWAFPALLLPPQFHPSAATNGSLKASWSGSLDKLQSTFDLTFSGPDRAAHNQLPISGHARGSLDDHSGLTLHLADAEIHTPHSALIAHGTMAERQAAPGALLNLTVATTDFEEWRPLFQTLTGAKEPITLVLASPAQFIGQLGGTTHQLSVQGQLSIGKFQYHGWTWDRLRAAVTLNRGQAEISAGRVDRGKSSFLLNASAQLNQWRMSPSSVVRLSAQAAHTPLEGLEAAVSAHFPVRGLVTGRIDLSGAVSNLTGAGVLRIDDGAIMDELFNYLSADLHVAQSVWKLGDIQVSKDHGRLSGDLTVEPARRFASGQLRGSDIYLADVQHLPLTTSSAIPHGPLNGRLSFEVTGRGTPDVFQLEGVWRVRSFGVAGASLGDWNGTVAGNGQELQFAGEEKGPAGRLHVTAQVTAAGDWPATAQGQYSELRVDPWLRAFSTHEFGASVTANGDFQVAGPLRVPAKLEIHTQARELSINFPSLQWKNVQPVEMRYRAGTLEVGRFVMRGPSTELAVDGGVHFGDRVTLALRAEGKADATLLAALDPHLRATGRSDLHLRLTGTPERPALNGTIDVQDVSVSYGDLPFRFNDLQGSIQLQGDRAVIRTLRGTSGGGTVDLGGSLTLSEIPRYDLHATLNQVRVRYPPTFTSVLSGSLRLVGDSDRGDLQGDVVVQQMFLNENGNWLTRVVESASPFGGEQSTGGVTSPIASRIRMSVRVTSSAPVRVETGDLRMVTEVDVRVQGTLADPVQMGDRPFSERRSGVPWQPLHLGAGRPQPDQPLSYASLL